MKKLAVIMSLYKNDKLGFLKQCVESILNQSYSEFNLYIQCDGPIKDECIHYLKSIDDTRVTVRERIENKGLAYSLNEILGVVLKENYEYIVRMDADDICLPDRFGKQVAFMDLNNEVDILGGYIEEIDESNNRLQFVNYPYEHNAMKEAFGKRNPLAHMTVFFRKTYFDKVGLYPLDTNLDEDTIFWLKGFMSNCKFANLQEVLVKVRVNSDFYGRRNGLLKSYSDFKNRLTIIKILNLSIYNYFWAFGRLVIMSIPFAGITKIAYKLFRK